MRANKLITYMHNEQKSKIFNNINSLYKTINKYIVRYQRGNELF
jgi:hypothetical protein